MLNISKQIIENNSQTENILIRYCLQHNLIYIHFFFYIYIFTIFVFFIIFCFLFFILYRSICLIFVENAYFLFWGLELKSWARKLIGAPSITYGDRKGSPLKRHFSPAHFDSDRFFPKQTTVIVVIACCHSHNIAHIYNTLYCVLYK